MHEGCRVCRALHQGGSSRSSIEGVIGRAQCRRVRKPRRKRGARIEARRAEVLPLLREGHTVRAVASMVGCTTQGGAEHKTARAFRQFPDFLGSTCRGWKRIAYPVVV